MKDSKLLQAIKVLSQKELRQFQLFADSPYFNRLEELRSLIAYFNSVAPEYEDAKIEKEVVFHAVFEGEAYDDLRLRHLFSDCLKLLERFLITEHVFVLPNEGDLHLLQQYNKRGLEKHFRYIHRKLQKGVKEEEFQLRKYMDQFFLESIYNDFLSNNPIKKGQNNIAQASSSLDSFYVLQKLRFACMQINYSNVYFETFEIFLLDEIIAHVDNKGFQGDALISVYYNILMMLRKPEETNYFRQVKAFLEADLVNAAEEMALEILTFAQNYCVQRINKGEPEYYEHLFEIYKEGLNQGVLLKENSSSHRTFNNIISVACHLEQFDWALEFVNEVKDYLKEDIREPMYKYFLSVYHWYKKDYSTVLRLMMSFDFEDPFYVLNTKARMLRIYFEQGETEALLSLCESFRMYLRRNKLVSDAHKRNHLNLIKYASRLSKVRPHQRDRLKKIQQQIENEKSVNNRKWLLDQVAHMEEHFLEDW